MDELTRQGIRLRDVRITVKDADVSIISLLRGDIEREIRTASLVAEAPEKSINDYLQENALGLEEWKIDVRAQEVVYRIADAVGRLVGGFVAWPLGSFVATSTYLLLFGIELSFANHLQRRRGDKPSDQ